MEKKWYERIWLLVLSMIVFFPVGLYGIYKHANLKMASKNASEIDVKRNIIKGVNYKHGHPDIDQPKLCNIELKGGNVYFLTLFKNTEFANILGSEIKNVLVEDASTFERRVTLARMALVGLFAFGMKKKKKTELGYLTIEWNRGRFEHSTMFEFSGFNSLKNANTARNKIIREIQ